MAEVLINLLKFKLDMVMTEKEKVDAYIDKITSSAKSALEADIKDMKTIRKINSELESVLEFLPGLGAETLDVGSRSASRESNSSLVSLPSSSTSLSEFPSDLPQRTWNTSETSDISKLYHRVEVLEAALPTCRSEISQTEKRYKSRLDGVDKQLEQMTTRCDSVMKQGDSRLDKVEKRLKKVETVGKQDGSRLDNLVKDVESLKSQYSKTPQSSKLDSLENQVDILKNEFSSVQDQLGDVAKFKQTTEETASKVKTLADKSDLIDIMRSARTTTKSLEELSLRVDATESFVKNSVSRRDEEDNKKKEFEDRLLVLELNRRDDLDHNMKKLEEGESKLNDVVKEVSEISTRVVNLETKNRQTPSGFTSYFNVTKPVTSLTEIKDFNVIRSNVGGHYDKTTGRFTAPCDGLYVTSLTLVQEGDGEIGAFIYHEKSSSGNIADVCYTITSMNKSSCCGLGLATMKAGDQLYVQTWNVTGNVQLSLGSNFSCFLLT